MDGTAIPIDGDTRFYNLPVGTLLPAVFSNR